MTKVYFCLSKGIKVKRDKAKHYCKHRHGRNSPCGALEEIPKKKWDEVKKLYESGLYGKDM